METTTPSKPSLFTHSASPNIVMMPVFAKKSAAEASAEEPEAPLEGEDDDPTTDTES